MTCCRGSKQGRVRWVGFTKAFFQNSIHFVIARCGSEGYEASLL
jgi:hypothetical protein